MTCTIKGLEAIEHFVSQALTAEMEGQRYLAESAPNMTVAQLEEVERVCAQKRVYLERIEDSIKKMNSMSCVTEELAMLEQERRTEERRRLIA